MNERHLAKGIIFGFLTVLPGLLGVTFLILGISSILNPQGGEVTVNGITMHGEEAVEEIIRVGKVFIGVGGLMLLVAAAMMFTCIVMVSKSLNE